ncbi:TPA: TnsA endonuclease N-terminal domain-containing protein [Salmonella enterica]|uniref:TnsA endonuclease N-terminal domain-containing protein n=1 Tax=Salmonella enterica TaxID=28901 RepID=UPI000806E427|nr:TnsA endonuclease N-terminal domain-containing protein [Salmonella enterica]ECS8648108.1 transposase [Salmonella enterica]EDF7988834.1 transposase [Salmonella enterica subsp. enterica serovar Weltevreden]EDL1610192.1 transposase [Salmonella enterica subsp. enterica serovar Weltevreden]EDV4063286.1 transposase [Salmonella enterica subsp. enterica serovar Weltevreden]EDX2564630.1 transposase [Salmonella enterica subsp. enterica serovar Weltevreden]
MSRGRRFTSLESYEKALKDGVGIGSGENYQPWIRPQDFKQSTGIRSAIRGLKTFRQHNTLSSIESEFYYLAEFNDAVIDIREQFPLLPITLTQNISRILNVPHPTLRRNVKSTDIAATPAVMTTDFVLTFRNPNGSIKYRAYSIKPDEIISKRDAEKQEIERLFWEGINIQFQVYTGSKINKIKSENINWFTAPFRMNGLPDLNIDSSILRRLPPGQYMISDIVKKMSLFLRIPPERSLFILKFMLATKSIEVDLTSDIVNCGYISVLRNIAYEVGLTNENN